MGKYRHFRLVNFLQGGMMNLLTDNETSAPDEWLVERMRLRRDALLVQSDWAMIPDTPTDKTAWAEYRQALRDFPATWTPSPTVTFPERP
jgi:hypothetical protein